MKAVKIHQRGGTEVLQLEEVATPVPQQGEVLIQVAVAGVNYADVGQRQGNYPNLAELPLTLGSEVAGTVVKCGPGVDASLEGRRVVSLVSAGYAEFALAKAEEVIPLVNGVSFAQATVIPVQGQTAYLLLDKATRLQKGERVLVHAAAGGVGSLAVQLAKSMGASMVIGTTTSQSKLGFIRDLGADVAVISKGASWIGQVMQATSGQGVDIILDPIGGEFGQQNIACLAPFGRIVVFGSLSGGVTPFVSQMLIPKCQSIIGYNTVIQSHEDKMRASQALMQMIASGQLHIFIDHSFPLTEVATAHKELEENKTMGKVVLTV
ncbi:MAG: zinc-binding dehydrogenase [Chloroflexota bacterium]|nr:zinc-binding dehydrogenase [Chloroflexota bacterium]